MKEMLNKIFIFYKSHERWIKTFFEAFFSYVAVNIAMTDFTSATAIEGLIVGAFASGLSVVINKLEKADILEELSNGKGEENE